MKRFQNRQVFALGSAVFAALTAIFGRPGVAEINPNLATVPALSGIATGLSWLRDYCACSSARCAQLLTEDSIRTLICRNMDSSSRIPPFSIVRKVP